MSHALLAVAVEFEAITLLEHARQRAAVELPEKIRDTAALVDYLHGRVRFAQLPQPPVPLATIAQALRQWADYQEHANTCTGCTEPGDVQVVSADGGYL